MLLVLLLSFLTMLSDVFSFVVVVVAQILILFLVVSF